MKGDDRGDRKRAETVEAEREVVTTPDTQTRRASEDR